MQQKIVLLECEIFPCLAWYQQYLTFEQKIIEQHEYFERTSLRNRYYIVGANGLQTLSIPLLGGRNQKTTMKEIKISYTEKWQQQHWKTIVSCYKNSPYFDYFEDEIQPLFEKQISFLMDYNLHCLQTINKILQVATTHTLTTHYEKTVANEITDYRKKIKADNFLQQSPQAHYIQVFEERHGFYNNVSILDKLFCVGKRASLF